MLRKNYALADKAHNSLCLKLRPVYYTNRYIYQICLSQYGQGRWKVQTWNAKLGCWNKSCSFVSIPSTSISWTPIKTM